MTILELSTPVRVVHDPDYVRAINSYIGKASAKADEIIGRDLGNDTAWAVAFHEAMDRMTSERGLRKASWLAFDGIQ